MISFPHFDVVRGVCIDSMHGMYGGVMKLLANLWFTTKGFWYCGNQLREVDDRLMAITPPTEISKEIRSLKDRNYWKGTLYTIIIT